MIVQIFTCIRKLYDAYFLFQYYKKAIKLELSLGGHLIWQLDIFVLLL